MTAEELIARAAQCETCGKEHKPITQPKPKAPSWASPDDGHPYRARMPRHIVERMRNLAGQRQ